MELFTIAVIVIVVLIIIFASAFTVQQQTVAIIQRLGKFRKMSTSGLNFKIPFIDHIAGRVNLRVNQLDVKIETKTEDNVFLHMVISVQYQVLPDKVYEAFYKLTNPKEQISSYVFDIVRARVPKLKLDDVFENQDEIANSVREQLAQAMSDYGYQIIKALVTDIEPDAQVKAAMNEINAAQRLQVAAQAKGEADKIIMVKKAEGEAESKKLQGEGIANQRKAIIIGLRESVDDFQKSIKGSTPQDVMNLVMITQYFDTLKDIGMSSKSNAVFIPHSPGAVAELESQIRNALIGADQVRSKE